MLLTSVTTFAGLVPLMFETSRQAQSLIPVATSIVFGISASTVLVLILLPAIYAVLDDLGLVLPSTAGEGTGGPSEHAEIEPVAGAHRSTVGH